MAYLKLKNKTKLIVWSDLIHLDFHDIGRSESWSITMTNRDPEGFLVSLREIDPSILIIGFFHKNNQIEGALVHCDKIAEIRDYLLTNHPPAFPDLESARTALKTIGIKVPSVS